MNERDIFIESLQQPSLERQAFLDRACGGDRALRRGVEMLLAAHARAGDFLAKPALVRAGSPLDINAPPPSLSANSAATVDLTPSEPRAPVEPDGLPSIPGYEILGELGRGGMGVVYKARQLSLNRLVALKMVRAGAWADWFDLGRFHAEAMAVARLQHPHIVAVHEVGKSSGLPFLSLEYVAGDTLARKLAGAPQLPHAAAALVETLARAVHHAHSHGIVHRDLKPANVLLTEDGTPKITDFGLAKRIARSGAFPGARDPSGAREGAEGTSRAACNTSEDEDRAGDPEKRPGMTQTGTILGTPSYMAPEQAQGQKEIGPAADVYALGAILYEMLTGRPPFKAATPLDTVMQVIGGDPVPLRRLQPRLPRDLETICLKCLQKEPGKRYSSALELADDLARFRQDRPIMARPVGRLERAWRWCRRSPVVAALLGLVVFGVAAAGWLLADERSQTFENLRRATKAEDELKAQLERIEDAERNRREQLWQSYRDQWEARRFSRQPGQRYASLAALAGAARISRSLDKGEEAFQDLRRKAIASLALPDLRRQGELPGWSADALRWVIDGDFERYALQDRQGAISVRRVADGREIRRLVGAKSGHHWFDMSPDGRYLAADDSEDRLIVHDLSRNEPALTLPAGQCSGVIAFSPDSRRLAVLFLDGGFGVCDLASGRVERRWKGTASGCVALSFDPDGHRLATVFRRPRFIQIWSADSGRLLSTLREQADVIHATWLPDGQLLAVTLLGSRFIHLWDAANGKRAGFLEGHKNSGLAIAFSPISDLAASNGWECMLRLWEPHTRREVLRMPFNGYPIFSRRGDKLLLKAAGPPQLWEVADGREYRTFAGDPTREKKEFSPNSISPDGRLLAASSQDGTILWEIGTGKELAWLPTGITWHVLFHPSGDLLTSGFTGLLRWPVRSNLGAKGEFIIRSPRRLVAQRTDGMGLSRDGRLLVVALSRVGARVIDFQHPDAHKELFVHTGINKASISPDGRWIATGCHHGTGIKVWSVGRDRLECELPITGSATPQFSPDGRWLATNTTTGLRMWKVGTWERGPSLPDGAISFSPDGRLVAVHRDYTITLIDLNNGRTLAALDDPNLDRPDTGCFSLDGSQLFVSAVESYSAHLWDLRRIRAGLKEIGLDWEAPDYPPPRPTAPVKLTVAGLGTLASPGLSPQQAREALRRRGEEHLRQKQWQEAAADFAQLARLEPGDSFTCLQTAILLLACEDRAGYRRVCRQMLERFGSTSNPIEAERTAQVCLLSADAMDLRRLDRLAAFSVEKGEAVGFLRYCLFVRGVSEYRRGREAAALAWFARSRQANARQRIPEAFLNVKNGLFEAMALHRLGRTEEASRLLEATSDSVRIAFEARWDAPGWAWHDWLFCRVALREAKDVLGSKPAPGRD